MDLIRLASYDWQPCVSNFVTSEKKALQNFLQNIEHRVAYSARNFVNWQFLAE